LGTYNLDSVIIDENQTLVSSDDLSAIRNIKRFDIQIKDLNEIILDGVEFVLIVRGQRFQWRTDSQISAI
jgi:hypothetical protein